MHALIFGASGMIGQAVLLECLADPQVQSVRTVGRRRLSRTDRKLTQIVHEDFDSFVSISEDLHGVDACFWCLGVSAAGMKESEYRKVTVNYVIAAMKVLRHANPDMTFVFVSGAGTDQDGKAMWARVKAEAEQAVLRRGFTRAHCVRPGGVQPKKGVVSRTAAYRWMYLILWPVLPLLRLLLPGGFTASDVLARAMIRLARDGSDKPILETRDINALGR